MGTSPERGPLVNAKFLLPCSQRSPSPWPSRGPRPKYEVFSQALGHPPSAPARLFPPPDFPAPSFRSSRGDRNFKPPTAPIFVALFPQPPPFAPGGGKFGAIFPLSLPPLKIPKRKGKNSRPHCGRKNGWPGPKPAGVLSPPGLSTPPNAQWPKAPRNLLPQKLIPWKKTQPFRRRERSVRSKTGSHLPRGPRGRMKPGGETPGGPPPPRPPSSPPARSHRVCCVPGPPMFNPRGPVEGRPPLSDTPREKQKTPKKPTRERPPSPPQFPPLVHRKTAPALPFRARPPQSNSPELVCRPKA